MKAFWLLSHRFEGSDTQLPVYLPFDSRFKDTRFDRGLRRELGRYAVEVGSDESFPLLIVAVDDVALAHSGAQVKRICPLCQGASRALIHPWLPRRHLRKASARTHGCRYMCAQRMRDRLGVKNYGVSLRRSPGLLQGRPRRKGHEDSSERAPPKKPVHHYSARHGHPEEHRACRSQREQSSMPM